MNFRSIIIINLFIISNSVLNAGFSDLDSILDFTQEAQSKSSSEENLRLKQKVDSLKLQNTKLIKEKRELLQEINSLGLDNSTEDLERISLELDLNIKKALIDKYKRNNLITGVILGSIAIISLATNNKVRNAIKSFVSKVKDNFKKIKK